MFRSVSCSVGALALAAFGLAGCGRQAARRAQTVPVTVARVEARDIPHEIEATGTVEPQQTVKVLAQVGGTIERIGFREGDSVPEGAVLFELDARPFRAALDQARAVLARDRAQADNARREAERSLKLAQQGAVSTGESEDKQAAAEALAATVRADSAAVDHARLNLLYATIRAPIAGRTGSRSVHVGDLVKPGDTERPLVTINRMRPVRIRFSVPQDALPAVLRSRDRELTVLAAAADRDTFDHVGRLVFVDNAVDPSTGTLLLKGEFENRAESLWPGEFVRVRLVLSSQPGALVVPAVAVTSGPDGPFVYVVAEDSTVSVRPVVVDRTRGDLAVIARGVSAREVVVTDGQLRLGPGARVALRPGVGEATAGRAGGAGAEGPRSTPPAAASGSKRGVP